LVPATGLQSLLNLNAECPKKLRKSEWLISAILVKFNQLQAEGLCKGTLLSAALEISFCSAFADFY
jgi:hypothetical protein